MSHALLHSPAFARSARRLLKKAPDLVADVQAALVILAADPFDATLKTHKLRGELKDSWAASAGYDLRIVFRFVRHKGNPAIFLEALGTHDEVY